MNRFSWLLMSVLAVTAVVGGCTQSDKTSASRPADSTLAKNSEMIEQIHDQRSDYLKKVEVDIKEWQRKMDGLRTERDKNPIHSARYVQLNRTIEELAPKLSLASQELETLKTAVASAWQEHKPSLDKTMSNIKETGTSFKAE